MHLRNLHQAYGKVYSCSCKQAFDTPPPQQSVECIVIGLSFIKDRALHYCLCLYCFCQKHLQCTTFPLNCFDPYTGFHTMGCKLLPLSGSMSYPLTWSADLQPFPWGLPHGHYFYYHPRTITRELSLAYALVKCFMSEWFITPYITPLTPQIHTSLP